MILTQIAGGLGNQMFQYACGRALAARLDTELKLDLSWFGQQNLRGYGLNAFNICGTMATPAEIEAAQTSATKPAGVYSAMRWLKTYRHWQHFPEKKLFSYDPTIEHITANKNVYLTGYWQSARYFANQAALIRDDFTLKQPLTEDEALATEMQDCQSVSLHIRRGDYVDNPKTAKEHLVCTLQYYQMAMQHIGSKVTEPHFYIFSDDPTWCSEHIHSDYPLKIASNAQISHHQELILMTKCRHHILSNSSFSWWGTWLSSNHGIIIIPDLWKPGFSTQKQDIIPPYWHSIILSATGNN